MYEVLGEIGPASDSRVAVREKACESPAGRGFVMRRASRANDWDGTCES